MLYLTLAKPGWWNNNEVLTLPSGGTKLPNGLFISEVKYCGNCPQYKSSLVDNWRCVITKGARSMHTQHVHPACTHDMHTRHAHTTCTHDLHTRFAHTTCTPGMHTRHVHTTCTHDMYTRHAHTTCTHDMHSAHTTCSIRTHDMHTRRVLTVLSTTCPSPERWGRFIRVSCVVYRSTYHTTACRGYTNLFPSRLWIRCLRGHFVLTNSVVCINSTSRTTHDIIPTPVSCCTVRASQMVTS